MSISRNHESAIVVTPATLKHQVITRINTLVNKVGGSYYEYDEQGTPKSLASIEGNDVFSRKIYHPHWSKNLNHNTES